MNLSNMKKMNDKPLRRVQGFDCDGLTHQSNNNLDLSQDFSIVFKIKTKTLPVISFQEVLVGVNYWLPRDPEADIIFYMGIYLQQDKFIAGFGEKSTGRYFVEIPTTPTNNTEYVLAMRNRNNNISIMLDGVIVEDTNTNVYYNAPIDYKYFGLNHEKVGESSEQVRNNIKSMDVIEILEIQDTLTDAQLLEFANLARFTDHSDYATFNKNAYYPLDYNTKDYSGNSNNGTVTGTEQYEIVERGIKSINDAEVLGKRGFKADGFNYVSVGVSTFNPQQFTIMCWTKVVTDIANNRQLLFLRNDAGQPALSYSRIIMAKTASGGTGILAGALNSSLTGSTLTYVGKSVTDGTYHCCVTFDLINKELKLFVDGTEESTDTFTETYIHLTTDLNLLGGMDDFWNNSMDETWDFKIFDSLLTQTQIKEEMRGNILPALGYLPLQEDTKDYSNNSNNGTVTGTEQYETVQNGLTDWKDPVLP